MQIRAQSACLPAFQETAMGVSLAADSDPGQQADRETGEAAGSEQEVTEKSLLFPIFFFVCVWLILF